MLGHLGRAETMLGHLGRAEIADELQQVLNDFRNCQYWKRGYVNIVNWFENQWLPLAIRL